MLLFPLFRFPYFQIEIVTAMPSGNSELLTPPPQPEEVQEEEEEESTPRLIDGSSPQEPEYTGVLGPHTNEGRAHHSSRMVESTLSSIQATKCQLHREPG